MSRPIKDYCENESLWQHLTTHIIINSQFMLYFNLLTKTAVFNHTHNHSVCNEALDPNTIPEHSSWMRCEVIDQEIVVLMWLKHILHWNQGTFEYQQS